MTSEGARLKAQLKLVGEAKAESHREVTDAHLALSIGERLARAVALSDVALRLHRETAYLRHADQGPDDDEAEVWARVYERLHRNGNTG